MKLWAASAYQVTTYNTLQASLLNASVTNLNRTGLPYASGDYTGAWQWNVVVPAGQWVTIRSFFGDLDLTQTPEPSPAGMVLAGVVAALAYARFRTSP